MVLTIVIWIIFYRKTFFDQNINVISHTLKTTIIMSSILKKSIRGYIRSKSYIVNREMGKLLFKNVAGFDNNFKAVVKYTAKISIKV
jgi:hypothetical protein